MYKRLRSTKKRNNHEDKLFESEILHSLVTFSMLQFAKP